MAMQPEMTRIGSPLKPLAEGFARARAATSRASFAWRRAISRPPSRRVSLRKRSRCESRPDEDRSEGERACT